MIMEISFTHIGTGARTHRARTAHTVIGKESHHMKQELERKRKSQRYESQRLRTHNIESN